MKQIVLLTILLVTGGLVSAQTLHLNRTGGTVAIGSDGQPVNSSAALDIKSTSQGVLLPRPHLGPANRYQQCGQRLASFRYRHAELLVPAERHMGQPGRRQWRVGWGLAAKRS